MTSLGRQDGPRFRLREGLTWILAAAREGPGSMTYAEEIRRQVEGAPRAALPAVTAALWRAYGDGKVTEAEAEAEALSGLEALPGLEALSGLIESRQAKTETISVLPPTNTAQDRQSSPRRAVGSRPRTG